MFSVPQVSRARIAKLIGSVAVVTTLGLVLGGCGSAKAAAPVTVTAPAVTKTAPPVTMTATATETVEHTPAPVTEISTLATTVVKTAATDAWLPLPMATVCSMMVGGGAAATGPTQRLTAIMTDINTSPTEAEKAVLDKEMASINAELSDMARHAPSQMYADFTALISFTQHLERIYGGTTGDMSFDMSEYKVPMLALIGMCTG